MITAIRWRSFEQECPPAWLLILVRTVEQGRVVIRAHCGSFDRLSARSRGLTGWANPVTDLAELASHEGDELAKAGGQQPAQPAHQPVFGPLSSSILHARELGRAVAEPAAELAGELGSEQAAELGAELDAELVEQAEPCCSELVVT